MVLPGAQRGFNIVELSVVVSILALLTAAVTGTYELISQSRHHAAASAELGQAQQALRTFIVRNKRLPCPDTSINGIRGRENGGDAGCPTGVLKGWLPYESVGLALPPPGARMRYAVYRKAGADLVMPTRAGAEFGDHDGAGGLLAALSKIVQNAPDRTVPYYPQPAVASYPKETAAGASPACDDAGPVANPAFALIAPVSDMDQADTPHPEFDTVNMPFVSSSLLCMAHPDRPSSFRHDDLVVAESAFSLLGWLTALER